MYVIYMDVLFLINFVMDLIIFYMVTMLLNKSIKHRRHIVGSIIASILYCMLIVIPVLQYIPYGLYALFIPVIPILYIYKPIHLKAFIKIYVLALVIAALLGGTTFSIWYMSGQYNQSIHKMSIFFLVGIGIGIGAITYFCSYYIRRMIVLPIFEYELRLVQKERTVHIKALLDTGNCLYTPITHKPVIVVEYKTVKPLLSYEQAELFEKYGNKIEELINEGLEGPKALIPFNSVGCEIGMLWGIEVDELKLYKKQYNQCFSRCIVGITKLPLFNDHSYKALLHPDYILGEVVG